ncbi:multidrug ABC transporter ATP-binding protein [Chromatiales bacterium (ex Bugula neritina AB1)]|nr:multidrug ABC transporter ATP-binding protein [Chromatiales bacterium (ex Bugula neritina AB1)]
MFNFFEKLTEAFPKKIPGTPPKNLLAFMYHYSRDMKWPLLLLSLLTASIAVFEVMLFGFLGQLVDWLSTKNPETLLVEESATLWQMTIVLLLVLPAIAMLHAFITHQTLLGNFPMAIRWLSHRYLLRQSISFFQDDFAGRIATKVMQTSLSIREAVMKLLDVFVYVSVYFVSMLSIVFTSSAALMIPMIVWLIFYSAALWCLIPRLKKVSTLQADARSTMTGRIVDSYTNISTVKLFAHTQREEHYAREGMDEFMQTVYLQMRYSTWLDLLVSGLNYLLIFSLAAMSIILWIDDAITVGAIAIAVSMALRLNGMSHWIMWELSALFEHIGSAADGRNTLATPLSIVDAPTAVPLAISRGEIRFDNIGFNYGGNEHVIENLSLHVRGGEKVGLVGRSGAGKSTLINLLLRFHDVENGQVLIDNQNISKVTQDSLRSQIGVVTQDTSLLHRSVKENILYGNPVADNDQMIEAARKAQAHEFIEKLSDPKGGTGYHAQVGERGVKLSGGQRQRIAIARVLLKDAPILLLDEATSALDSEVEAAIQQSLFALMQDKTVIAIAHRLSTIAAMDRLVVMDAGQIVEQGTHQELINAGGIYATLWSRQTQGFIGSDALPGSESDIV